MKKVLIGLVALLIVGAGFVAPGRVREVTKLVEVPAKERSFGDYLTVAARAYGVPESVAFAMAHQESGGKMDAIRHEPGQMERARKLTKASGEQLRMYASSHCALQVMGWHAPGLGLSWADLYKPETCAEVGMKILAQCIQQHRGKDAIGQMHSALKCYNGGDEYARTVLNRLGHDLLRAHLKEKLRG
jgi:soluble lytic murein transglycosylase-like protein